MMLAVLLGCAAAPLPDHGWMMVHRCLEWGTENSEEACLDGVVAMESDPSIVGMETDWCWADEAPRSCHECGACGPEHRGIEWEVMLDAIEDIAEVREDALFVIELKDTIPGEGRAMVDFAAPAIEGLEDHIIFSAFDEGVRDALNEHAELKTAHNAVTNPLPTGLDEDDFLITNTGSTNGAQLARVPLETEVILYNVDSPHTRGRAADMLQSGAADYIMANELWEEVE